MVLAFYFIVKSLAHLYVLLFILRFWLPLVQADFRNPVAQGILRFTAPLIVPLRRFVPSLGRMDSATVLVTYALEFVVVFVLFKIASQPTSPLVVAIVALKQLVIFSLHLFSIAIFVRVVISWLGQHSYNPLIAIASALADPVVAPFRRLIPPLGGIDFSPMVTLILLQATVIYVHSLVPVSV